MEHFAVVIPAAGSGARSGSELPKQYVELGGARVLEHTVRAFLGFVDCLEIVLAVDERWRDVAHECCAGDPRARLVTGGAERQDSIARALASLASPAPIVLVHDAARPCVSAELVERVVVAVTTHRAAVPVVPVAETVKRVDADGRIVATIPRTDLRLAQTPQGFERALLERAYAAAADVGLSGTDDASLVEAIGCSVMSVEGDPENVKITVPGDFARAAAILAAR